MRRTLLALAAIGICTAALLVTLTSAQGSEGVSVPAEYGLLRTQGTPSDPGLFAGTIINNMLHTSQLQPDVATARTRVLAVTGAPGLFRDVSVATASPDDLCLVAQDHGDTTAFAAMTCASEDVAFADGLVLESQPAPGPGVDPAAWDLTALFPDGVATVTLALASGQHQTLDVSGNLVTAHLASAPVGLSYVNTAGVVQARAIGGASS